MIEEIKEKIRLSSLISERTEVIRKGGRLWAKCPFHGGGNERTPSFTFDDESGRYHCFGCGESGNIFSFVEKTEHITFPEAVRFLASKAGIALEEENAESRRKRDEKESLKDLYKRLTKTFRYFLTDDKMGEKARIDQDRCVGCGRCIAVCPFDAIEPVFDEAPDVLNYKIVEYAMAAVKDKPCLHVTVICDVSPYCDCHGENDVPVVPNVGILASTDPVALDRACIDLVQKQPMIPGSMLYRNCDGRKPADIFKCVQPSTHWQSTFEHAERMGFGSSDYEIVEVR